MQKGGEIRKKKRRKKKFQINKNRYTKTTQHQQMTRNKLHVTLTIPRHILDLRGRSAFFLT